MVWHRSPDTLAAQRLQSFITVTEVADNDGIALFKCENKTDIGLGMHELGELVESHRERLAHSLTPPSTRKWLQRECELALLGAKRLHQVFSIPLHDSIKPLTQKTARPIKEAPPTLSGEGQTDYAGLMQRLLSRTPRL